MFFNSILLLFFLFLLTINGDKYVYDFLKLNTINVYQVSNETIVLTTKGYNYNTYDKPKPNINGQAIFEMFSNVPKTFEYIFDQFLIGTNEYLRFIDPQNGDYYKYGSDIIHRGSHAYYQITGINSTIVFGCDDTLKNDTFNHTGIKVFIRERNPNKYWCSGINNNHNIFIDIEPYFLLSYNYPYTTPTNKSCTFNVNSNSEYLRVFIYDFRLNSNVNEFVQISGQLVNSINDDDVDPNFLTGYLTSDLPVTFYYKGNITINVSELIGQSLSKFFIKISPYNSTKFDNPYNDYCLGINDISRLSQSDSITFGIKSYTNSDFYKINSKCTWNFNDLTNKNLRFLFNLAFESEYGCDYLEMNGFGANLQDIWKYQGFQSQKFIYATNTSNVALKWISDGVQNAIGFMGTARLQDCSCPEIPSTISYNDSPIYIYNPGYKDTGIPYCPNVMCNWNINYNITNEYLIIENILPDLRNPSYFGKISNTIFIMNKFNRTLLTLTASNILFKEKILYSSSGNTNIQWVSDTSNVFDINNIKRGFNFKITTKLFSNFEEERLVNLTDSYNNVFISGTVKSTIIKIIGNKGFIKIIPQKYFMTSNVILDIFKNDISMSNIVDDSYFFTSDAYLLEPSGLLINSNVVYIRIYKATDDDNDKVNYDFFVSDLNFNSEDTNNLVYQHIPPNQLTVINVDKLMYINVFNDNENITNGMIISPNGTELSIFNEENILISLDGIYPLYIYGNSLSLSVKNNSQSIIFSPLLIPPVLTYKFFNSPDIKNIIYSKDYMTSYPEKMTKMNFVFLNGPRSFNLIFMEFRGPGEIEILIYNEGKLYNKEIISKINKEHYIFCGEEIELNYDSKISNFSILPNTISGFKGLYQVSSSCKPEKNSSLSIHVPQNVSQERLKFLKSFQRRLHLEFLEKYSASGFIALGAHIPEL
ncbi:CUB domain-containing protein [Strongyloides ratti]|uniref:CUB domain-containing protein n=1 Tax=Strongyloides ratti TaxID=34506 RepID=A0A090LN58_STRRB|nr:CUB domain-containing protein [Strongyloides ratti]CEF71275.1 CUB domain-containing protein [Strongyloides ratti]